MSPENVIVFLLVEMATIPMVGAVWGVASPSWVPDALRPVEIERMRGVETAENHRQVALEAC